MKTTTEDKKSTSLIPGWISSEEMGAMLNLKVTSLWKLRSRGQVIWSRVGGRIFYKMESVLQLLEKNSNTVEF